jgi:DNA-damage-inducible protein J
MATQRVTKNNLSRSFNLKYCRKFPKVVLLNDNVNQHIYFYGVNMTANALVQARINESIKEEAAIVLAAIGLTVSDAVRLLLTRVARDHAMPFEPLIPNAKTIAAMKEARHGKLKSFDSVEDLMADLNAKD